MALEELVLSETVEELRAIFTTTNLRRRLRLRPVTWCEIYLGTVDRRMVGFGMALKQALPFQMPSVESVAICVWTRLQNAMVLHEHLEMWRKT